MPRALFIGAHPDDIEIGAGGTLARLVAEKWDVAICVMTDSPSANVASHRRSEAIAAARMLGLPTDAIGFMRFPDTALAVDGPTIAAVRRHVRTIGFDPDVVFTHSLADSHNDHKATAGIVQAVFREKLILGFPVVNSLNVSAFRPRIIVDVTQQHDLKMKSLGCHRSQVLSGRVAAAEVRRFDHETGKRLATGYAEAFDTTVQYGASYPVESIALLSGCPFVRFWHSLLGERPLHVIHGVPPAIADRIAYENYAWHDVGMSIALREAFDRHWPGLTPIRQHLCVTPGIHRLMQDHDVLLSGGPITNSIVRNVFNQFAPLRYAIDCSGPQFQDPHIVDRDLGKTFFAQKSRRPQPTVSRDLGLITIMRNPHCGGRVLLNAAGLHGPGTVAAHQVLTSRELLQNLCRVLTIPFASGIDGYQLMLSLDTRSKQIDIDFGSLAVLKGPRTVAASSNRPAGRRKGDWQCVANASLARKSTAIHGCGFGATRSGGRTAAARP